MNAHADEPKTAKVRLYNRVETLVSNQAAYTFRGTPVVIPRTADASNAFKPGGKFSEIVQAVIDSMDDMEDGDRHIATRSSKSWPFILPLAVEVPRGNKLHWAQLKWHKAREVGLSPITQMYVPRAMCDRITLHLEFVDDRLWLVRAYGGSYTPPLPWMKSVGHSIGGKQGSIKYWREHAYLLGKNARIDDIARPWSINSHAPDWYTAR